MNLSINPKYIASLIAGAIITASTPACADEVILPKGNLNGGSATCPVNATSATLNSKDGQWTMKLGNRIVLASIAGDEWDMMCNADGLSMRMGTKCFFDGYIVAGFEPEAMRVACYEGQIPDKLKRD